MRKQFTLFSFCIGILLFIGCNSIDLPKGYSKGYSSYRIYKHSPEDIPDFSNRKDRTNELIKAALKKEFDRRGLKELDATEDAELVVAFLLIVQDNATSSSIRDYYINSGGEILSKAHKRYRKNSKKSKKYYTESYLTGSLIVDIIDQESNELIYRDYVTRKVFDSMSEEERGQGIVDAVAEVTARFFRQ